MWALARNTRLGAQTTTLLWRWRKRDGVNGDGKHKDKLLIVSCVRDQPQTECQPSINSQCRDCQLASGLFIHPALLSDAGQCPWQHCSCRFLFDQHLKLGLIQCSTSTLAVRSEFWWKASNSCRRQIPGKYYSICQPHAAVEFWRIRGKHLARHPFVEMLTADLWLHIKFQKWTEKRSPSPRKWYDIPNPPEKSCLGRSVASLTGGI